MRLTLETLFASLLITACTGAAVQQPPSEDAKPTAPPEDGLTALRDKIQAASADLFGLSAPIPPKEPTIAQAKFFISGTLKEWLAAAEKKLGATIERLRALEEDTSPDAQVAVLLAEAEAIHFVLTQFESSGRAAIPTSWKNDPEIAKAFYGALTDAVNERRGVLVQTLRQCAALKPLRGQREDQEKCVAMLSELEPTEPADKREVEDEPSAPEKSGKRLKYEFSRETTTLEGPCSFSGSLGESIEFFLPTGEPAPSLGRLNDARVRDLQLGKGEGQLASGTLAWPLKGKARFSSQGLFRLRSKVDVEKERLWIRPQDNIAAHHKSGSTAVISVQLPTSSGSNSRSIEVPCSNLRLVGEPITLEENGEGEEGKLPEKSSVRVSRDGQELIVAGGHSSSVRILERKDGWSFVQGTERPFGFRGWVENKWVERRGRGGRDFGMIGLLGEDAPPTALTARDTPLHIDKVETGVVVAAGVPLLFLGDGDDELVSVTIAGLRPGLEQAYYVRKSDTRKP